ncbi:MAG: DNA-directed RNA polymerase [Zestosphaera tikiterensis]|uniref:DNA-directed RNA polymerase subunit Rpo7 n=1 Tax=Zestosphaera tikiterensis TaxID=1973259 RepID=A0A2R7Y7G8_9CREN|nr:MAG: DNA-directed RNA polymerase [Zestosphaera tikiterensis]
MFRIVTIEDVIRIPPDRFGEDLHMVAFQQLKEKYVGRVDPEIGLTVLVWRVDIDPEGTILPEDGATYHKAIADLVTFYPVQHEVIEGEVVDVKRIGLFINIGPVDAFAHISQLADDKFKYDELRDTLVGEESKITFKKGDIVRGRVVNVSLSSPAHIRVGLTLRQPALGKIKEG